MERATARLESVVRCTDLDSMVGFLTTEVGMRVESISPADSPAVVVMSGRAMTLRVVLADRDVGSDYVVRDAASERVGQILTAPNGSRFEFVTDTATYDLPASVAGFSLVRDGDGSGFGVGRAGMEYRDLLPDRWGGRFIASHIRIPGGGPVADSVHFHRIRFQMIFCASGWVDLVYEDQGAPFRLSAGDCVLQPPEIRHRVLRASPGLEVIEIGCPAVHDTFIEHDIELPTAVLDPHRDFGGQRFVRDVAAHATWEPWLIAGLGVRETGIADATDGLASASVIAVQAPSRERTLLGHDGEFLFDVILGGTASLHIDPPTHPSGGVMSAAEESMFRVGRRDAVAIPSTLRWTWSDWTDDFEFLEVRLPAT
jgi:hypothetical protein